mgnify:CR=1 FL=1
MVTLYIGGEKVANWAEAEKLFAENASKKPIEFRDENGRPIAYTLPGGEPIVPWDPTITREDIERIKKEPGLTFEEVKKRLGWE